MRVYLRKEFVNKSSLFSTYEEKAEVLKAEVDEKEKDYALKDILVADPNGDQTLQKAVVETVRGKLFLWQIQSFQKKQLKEEK